MPFLGLTGGFCTGKTTVLNMFSSLGAKTLNADAITYRLYKKGTRIYKQLVKEFGNQILNSNKEIDRRKLSKIVFSSQRKLKKLEEIVHPQIIKIIKDFLKRDNKKEIKIVEVPLLFEKKLEGLFDYIICVSSYKKNSIERAKKRLEVPIQEIKKRIDLQIPLREKEKKADFVIKNNKDLESLKKEVEKLWRRIQNLN